MTQQTNPTPCLAVEGHPYGAGGACKKAAPNRFFRFRAAFGFSVFFEGHQASTPLAVQVRVTLGETFLPVVFFCITPLAMAALPLG